MTIKEFLNNPKDCLDMAETTPLVLTGKENKKFHLSLGREEDDEILLEFQDTIDRSIQQARNGETIMIGDGSVAALKKFFSSDKK